MARVLLVVPLLGLIASGHAAPARSAEPEPPRPESPRIDLSVPAVAAPAAAPVDKSRFTFFTPTPAADLRGLSTDRPAKGYSPITVDAGHVQYETDILAYTHSNAGGAASRQFTAFDPTVKIGLTDRVEFGLQFGGYNWQDTAAGASGTGSSARGVGDLTLRPKINIFGNEGGVALGIIPFVKFPTASRSLGNGHLEGGVILPFATPLPYGFTLGFAPEVDVLRNGADAGHHINFTQAVILGHTVGKKLTLYGEFYSSIGPDHGSPDIYTADVAAAYLLTDSVQVDVGANFGLNAAAPNVAVYSGVSQRF